MHFAIVLCFGESAYINLLVNHRGHSSLSYFGEVHYVSIGIRLAALTQSTDIDELQ